MILGITILDTLLKGNTHLKSSKLAHYSLSYDDLGQ